MLYLISFILFCLFFFLAYRADALFPKNALAGLLAGVLTATVTPFLMDDLWTNSPLSAALHAGSAEQFFTLFGAIYFLILALLLAIIQYAFRIHGFRYNYWLIFGIMYPLAPFMVMVNIIITISINN